MKPCSITNHLDGILGKVLDNDDDGDDDVPMQSSPTSSGEVATVCSFETSKLTPWGSQGTAHTSTQVTQHYRRFIQKKV